MRRALHIKSAINILAILALVFSIIYSIPVFRFFASFINGSEAPKLVFSLSEVLSLAAYLLHIVPRILLVIYLFKFYKESNENILLSVIFGLSAITSVYSIIQTLLLGYTVTVDIGDLIYIIPFILAFILAGIYTQKNKVFLIIAAIVGLLYALLSVLRLPSLIELYLEMELYLYIYTQLASTLGSIAFYVALLLFGLNYRVLSALRESANGAEKMNPEQALALLNEQLELGMITAEEYQAQRAEIIANL